MKLPFSKIRVLIFTLVGVVSLIILLSLYGITFNQINTSLNSSQKLMHANDIEIELRSLISHLQQAETSQRGYIITRDSAFLSPFISSRKSIEKSFSELENLLSDDQVQITNLRNLERIVDERYQLLNITASDTSAVTFISPTLRLRLEQGSELMNRSYKVADDMIMYQNEKLHDLAEKHVKLLITTLVIYLILVLISILVFGGLLIKVNADRKKLKKVNDELVLTNQSYEQAEELAELGNWLHDFQIDKSTYSANFYRLLGLKPFERDLNLRFFLQMVHENDRPFVLEHFKRAFREHQSFTTSYRIHSKDNRLKYIKSVGKIYSDEDGKKHLLGINMDVTELTTSNRMLEVKNRKLEHFNADLASFNYVASHDLQAPLRKIQMFISRIFDVEKNNLSETGYEYFKRIHASASHMQTLINDLLMFSRTNAGNKRFEKTDLNEVLANAIEELIIVIEEKDAMIAYDSLPVINAIPYQIQQLFINLISNSLKFSREGVPPEIKITCETERNTNLNYDDEFTSEYFHKIVVEDNGIGFDQQYAEKIFNLLFRLHDKTQFNGSGIGLAICKKIIENHSGFITADSTPDIGSKFTIYLPTNLQ